MTTYPLASLSAQVSETGISAPSYDDIYLSLVAQYQAIYGSDVVLSADSQDGQWVGIIAQAITDVNAAAVAVYNSFSPSSARGAGLSSVVKINGIARQSATYSTCPVLITGTAGTVITAGVVADDTGNRWSLPASVTIPPSSSITVTATCQTIGDVEAAIGSITGIRTPTRGWLSVTNEAAAAVGVPLESDATLRKRQTGSTALSARTPMESIAAVVENLVGVTRINYSENPTGTTNSDGVPPHSFTMVVEGGDAAAIAKAIADNKLGAGTDGAIVQTVINGRGIPSIIRYDTPTYKRVAVALAVKPLAGYTIAVGNALIAAIASYITELPIGSSISVNEAIVSAIEGSGARGKFTIPPDGLRLTIFGGTLAPADIPIAFNEAATCDVEDVALSIVS